MKKCCLIFFFTFLLLNQLKVTAQNTDLPVRFKTGDLITGNNIQRKSFQKDNLKSSLFNNYYYVLLQFSILPSAQIRQELKNAGVELNEYIPHNAYLAAIHNNFDFTNATHFGIISVNSIPGNYKIDPALLTFQKNNDKQDIRTFAVSFFSSIDKKTVETALQQMGVSFVLTKFNFTNTILIQPDVSKLNAIAALPFVVFISEQSIKDKIINYNSVATHGISSLQSVSGRNLNGKNIVVGVGDNADISTHIDFTGKLISRHPFPWDYHGTHTSGTTAGAGFLNPRNHGMAPKAHIVSQWFSDVILNTPTYYNDFNMLATNNSYYSSVIPVI